MKDMIKDALILFVITLIAGLALGYVYHITKTPILSAEMQAKIDSYKEVFAEADSFGNGLQIDPGIYSVQWEDAGFKGISINEVVEAQNSEGDTIGFVLLINTRNGYGGDISFSMGIANDGTVTGVSILSISETAGLGMRAEEVLVPQYKGVLTDKFEVIKTEKTSDDSISAISGATITSKALTNAVNAGLFYFNSSLGGGY